MAAVQAVLAFGVPAVLLGAALLTRSWLVPILPAAAFAAYRGSLALDLVGEPSSGWSAPIFLAAFGGCVLSTSGVATMQALDYAVQLRVPPAAGRDWRGIWVAAGVAASVIFALSVGVTLGSELGLRFVLGVPWVFVPWWLQLPFSAAVIARLAVAERPRRRF